MKHLESAADRFVSAVHRRTVIVSSLEQFGIAFLSGSLLATLLLAMAVWQSMPTVPILIFCAVLSSLVGAVLTIFRWPNRRTAAIEADRQLRFDDLLSSAVLFSNSRDDFATAMIAMANARCAMHSPSEVIFRRFGVTRWAAIGLAMSVAVMLAVIPFSASKSQAIDANVAVLSATPNGISASIQSTAPARMNSTNNDPTSEAATNSSTQTDQQIDALSTKGNHSPSSSSTNASGIGGGIATTDSKTATALRPGESRAQPSSENGSSAGGGTASNTAAQNHEKQTGVERGNASTPAATWNGDQTQDGHTAVSDTHVPPEHRDLVHDFFNGK